MKILNKSDGDGAKLSCNHSMYENKSSESRTLLGLCSLRPSVRVDFALINS